MIGFQKYYIILKAFLPSEGKFVIPGGFGRKSAHLFAQVFPPKILLLIESSWNGDAARGTTEIIECDEPITGSMASFVSEA